MKIKFTNKRHQKVYDWLCENKKELLTTENYVTLDDMYYDLINAYEEFYHTANPDHYTNTAQHFAGIIINAIEEQICNEFAKKFTLNYAIREYKKNAKLHKYDLDGVAYGKISEWLKELKELRALVKKSNEF